MNKGAHVSDCGRYRYRLWRKWGDEGGASCCFVMLNPSTADAENDDATIRRCIAFAKREGYASLSVVNLFAWRSTDPKAMFRDRITLDAPIAGGLFNDAAIFDEMSKAGLIIVAWGAQKEAFIRARVDRVREYAVRCRQKLYCLGRTKNGQPRHPVRLAGNTPLELFT